jgi:glycosyltransferase involved in cell wall biosynthesis
MNLNIAIVIFAYNRPSILAETLKALRNNVGVENYDIVVYCDGAKENAAPTLLEKVKEVRTIAKAIHFGKNLTVNESAVNKGLANSLVAGITDSLKRYDAVIVLEDDIKTSPYFLTYMHDALHHYKDKEDVISISGYNYPLNIKDFKEETFFIRGADCWGWATWKRGWALYENNGQKLLDELKETNKLKTFDFNGGYAYSKMLEDTIKTNKSWAVKWYASAFLKNKLTLYPTKSYVENIGVGAEGTNTKTDSPLVASQVLNNEPVKSFNNSFVETATMRKKMEKHFKKYNSFSFRLYNFLKARINPF